jgi:hypothetical protein
VSDRLICALITDRSETASLGEQRVRLFEHVREPIPSLSGIGV